jgi:hypothetical protein
MLFTIKGNVKRHHPEPSAYVHDLLFQVTWLLTEQLGSGPSAVRTSTSHRESPPDRLS